MSVQYTPAGYCPRCGYRVDPGRCPECGADVAQPLRRLRSRARRRVVLLATLLMFVVVGVGLWRYGPSLAARVWPTRHLVHLGWGQGPLARWARQVVISRGADRWQVEHPLAIERHKRIESEIAKEPNHDWAGDYALARGPAALSLSVAPESGFVTRLFVLGHGSVTDHGSVSSSAPDTLHLAPRIGLPFFSPTIDRPLGHDMRVVRWGSARALVPLTRVLDLCNDISCGMPLDERHLVRLRPAPDVACPRTAVSWDEIELPPDWCDRLLDEPLHAEILTVEQVRAFRYSFMFERGLVLRARVKLNRGCRDGVWIGMRFCAREAGRESAAYVVQLDASTCEAEYFDSGLREPACGDELTSRPPPPLAQVCWSDRASCWTRFETILDNE